MYVLGMFFMTIILVPLAILAKTRDQSINDLFDDNKVHKESAPRMIASLLDIIDKNMGKKIKTLTDDRLIDVLLASFEMETLPERL
jgi:hypothetical protein